LRDVVKDEIEKLLQVDFIYVIYNSIWVSPLVVVPKKNGKWIFCMDYKALNKDTSGITFLYLSLIRYLKTLLEKIFFIS